MSFSLDSKKFVYLFTKQIENFLLYVDQRDRKKRRSTDQQASNRQTSTCRINLLQPESFRSATTGS